MEKSYWLLEKVDVILQAGLPIEEFIANVPGNGKFLYSAFSNFTNQDIVNLLQKHGVKTKQERGNRIFPVSNRSVDVLEALLQELKQNGVEIKTNTQVMQIRTNKDTVEGVICKNRKTQEDYFIKADCIVLATGGKSYSKTGSSGDGYEFAKKLGHTIIPIKPSLVSLACKQSKLCKDLAGLSLKNVAIKLLEKDKKKIIYEDFGEMLFTHLRSVWSNYFK